MDIRDINIDGVQILVKDQFTRLWLERCVSKAAYNNVSKKIIFANKDNVVLAEIDIGLGDKLDDITDTEFNAIFADW